MAKQETDKSEVCEICEQPCDATDDCGECGRLMCSDCSEGDNCYDCNVTLSGLDAENLYGGEDGIEGSGDWV